MGYYFLGEKLNSIMPNCMSYSYNTAMPNFFTPQSSQSIFLPSFSNYTMPNFLEPKPPMSYFSGGFTTNNFFQTQTFPMFTSPSFSVVDAFGGMCSSMLNGFDPFSGFKIEYSQFNLGTPFFGIFEPSQSSKKKQTGKKYSANFKYDQYKTKSSAIAAAKKDPNLEELKNTNYITINNASFKTDIPFAKKGTMTILEKVSKILGYELIITSALATGHPDNPHAHGNRSHHNANNPKLDFAIPSGMSDNEFADKLRKTGYFSHVLPEGNHVDVEIDISKFA